MKKIKLQAHRGVATDYPENTMSAFIGAKEQGYDIIELDPSFTSDGEFLIIHGPDVNRTGRLPNGEKIKEEKLIENTTLSEMRSYDFGIFKGEQFKGEKVPTLEEVLEFSKRENMPLKMDNKFEKFPKEKIQKFLDIIEKSNAPVEFTCANHETIINLSKRFTKTRFHYDGLVTREILEELSKHLTRERLVVWAPYKNESTSWVQVPFISEELVKEISKYAQVGAWILTKQSEFDDVKQYDVDIVETDGGIKPARA